MSEGGSLGIRDSTIFAEPDEELTWTACQGMCTGCFESANTGNRIKNMKHTWKLPVVASGAVFS